MLNHLGSFISRYWILVLLSWVVLVVGIDYVSPEWDDVTHDGDFAYLPEGLPSVRGRELLEAAFPGRQVKSQIGPAADPYGSAI